MLGKTAAQHTSAEFVAFLADIVVNRPRGKEIHVIADISADRPGPRRFTLSTVQIPSIRLPQLVNQNISQDGADAHVSAGNKR